MPLAVVCVILMQLLPSEVRPLVPALQSTWLHVHVTLAMLSYAACAVSCALAMMFLIQDDFKTETFLAWTSAHGQRDLRRHRRHSLREAGAACRSPDGTRRTSPTFSSAAACGCSSPCPTWDGCSSSPPLAAIVPLALYFVGRVEERRIATSESPTRRCSSAFCCRLLCWLLSFSASAMPATRHPTRMDSSRPAWPPAPSYSEAW